MKAQPRNTNPKWADREQPLVAHLIEFRDRVLRASLSVLLIWICLLPFYQELYTWLATPLLKYLPDGTSMVAIEVVSPFFVPIKLSFLTAVFLGVPFILYQVWGFVAPGLYERERKVVLPLIISSSVLFYIGVAFAYYLIFPLVFSFISGAAPAGVTMMTDINHYLNFALTLFFAFGVAFEVPVATFILTWIGIVTPEELVEWRPYVIVGIFFIAMFITPPDAFSQTLLAMPMWGLFEIGIWVSRRFLQNRAREEAEEEARTNGHELSAFYPAPHHDSVETSGTSSEKGDFTPTNPSDPEVTQETHTPSQSKHDQNDDIISFR